MRILIHERPATIAESCSLLLDNVNSIALR